MEDWDLMTWLLFVMVACYHISLLGLAGWWVCYCWRTRPFDAK